MQEWDNKCARTTRRGFYFGSDEIAPHIAEERVRTAHNIPVHQNTHTVLKAVVYTWLRQKHDLARICVIVSKPCVLFAPPTRFVKRTQVTSRGMKVSKFISGVSVAFFGESEKIEKRRRGGKLLDAEVVLAELSSELSAFSLEDDDSPQPPQRRKVKLKGERKNTKRNFGREHRADRKSRKSLKEIDNLWEEVSSELSMSPENL